MVQIKILNILLEAKSQTYAIMKGENEQDSPQTENLLLTI